MNDGVAIVFTGMCEGCKQADLYVFKQTYSRFYEDEVEWHINCKHWRACKVLKERMMEQYETHHGQQPEVQ